MLAFIDESGDSGFKLDEGSSRFFAVGLVVFEDHAEAIACDQRIELLRREIGWRSGSEFHFQRNSDRIRRTFLAAVAPYNFFYYGIVLNKDPRKLWGDGFRVKESFYKYTCGLIFENAKAKLMDAIVVIDESGSLDFKRQLATYLRRKLNDPDGQRVIKRVKMQRSSQNNLLQLADYIASTVNRSVQNNKRHADAYRRIVAHREISVQVWPRL